MTLKIHSATDLITNSSTVIFTYSEDSEKAVKDMIDEIFNTFSIDKKCEDVFKPVILCDNVETYEDYIERLEEDEMEYPEDYDPDVNLEKLYNDVITGVKEKPEWFGEAESTVGYYDEDFTPSTYLYLVPTDQKYANLAKLVQDFLYSPGHEAAENR